MYILNVCRGEGKIATKVADVARLRAEGKSKEEIASTLGLTVGTVNVYLTMAKKQAQAQTPLIQST